MKRIPDLGKAEACEVLGVCGSKFGYPVMAKSKCKPGINDAPDSEVFVASLRPYLTHDRRGFHKHPPGMSSKGLAKGDGIRSGIWICQNARIAQFQVDFDQHQFANRHILPAGQRIKKSAGGGILRCVEIGCVNQEIGIKGKHGYAVRTDQTASSWASSVH